MIDNIIINKKNNFYQINLEENNNLKNLNLILENIYLPFGLEQFKNKYSINFEINEDSEFYKIIIFLESKIKDLIKMEDVTIKPIFNKRDGFKILCKGNIKKTKNVFITKYKINSIESSIFNLEKNNIYKLDLEISGIWVFNKTAGLYINIKTIYKQ